MLSLGCCAVNVGRGGNRDAVIHHFHIRMDLFGPLLPGHFELLGTWVVDVRLEIVQLKLQVLFEDTILQLSLQPRGISLGGERVGDSFSV